MRLPIITVLALSACTFSIPQEPEPVSAFELVWEDDFDGPEGQAPNPDNWAFDIGNGEEQGVPGWGNDEIQYYTDRPENVSLNGQGFLRIRAIQEDFEGFDWTSARIKSQGLQEFQYGRMAMRARVPVEQGIWSAFWMLGADIEENPWPLAGEIDIMEIFGTNYIGNGALHGPGYSGGANANTGRYRGATSEDWASEFHIFEAIWDPQSFVFLIDGEVTGTLNRSDLPDYGPPWVFDHDFFFLLNIAVGGNAGAGAPDGTTPAENTMAVDLALVWERVDTLPDPLAAAEDELEGVDEADEEEGGEE